MNLPNDILLENRFLCLCQSLNRISVDVSHRDFYNSENANIYRSFCYGEFSPTESSAKRFKFTLDAFMDRMSSGEFAITNFLPLVAKMSQMAERRSKIIDAQQVIKNMSDMSYDVKSSLIEKPQLPSQCVDEVIEDWSNDEVINFDNLWSIGQSIRTFNTGHVLLLCGMSGTGKTNFAIQVCEDICNSNDEKWLFISLEMQKKSIFERIMKIAFYRNNPDLTFSESNEYFEKNKTNRKYFESCMSDNMYIIDKSGLDITAIETIVKGQVEKDRAVKTVVIDYVQIISHTTDDYKALSEISRKVPEIAKKYDVRIILLSQLTKDNYDNTKPTPRSIKGAGGLFDNSDEVWCLFRNKDENPYLLELMHWKSRHNGAYGVTPLEMNGLHVKSQDIYDN